MERSPLTLSQALEKDLCWHIARLECFTGMILALIGAKNVQLPYMAQHFGGGAEDKIEAMRSAGMIVADSPAELGKTMLKAMEKAGVKAA